MKKIYHVYKVSEEKADLLVDDLIFCAYCNEPFKECDTIIPGVGLILGETDVVRYNNKFWHNGCISDSLK